LRLHRPNVRRRSTAAAVTAILAATSIAGCTASPPAKPAATAAGIGKIRHVVVIMQENRSFDSFFGTYPGADGIREDAKILGNLVSDFDFNQKPRPPVLLPTHPSPGPASTP
jgi:phospholipase C